MASARPSGTESIYKDLRGELQARGAGHGAPSPREASRGQRPHPFATSRRVSGSTTRLDSVTPKRYIDALSVTGLISNPTIFDYAIKNSTADDGRAWCPSAPGMRG